MIKFTRLDYSSLSNEELVRECVRTSRAAWDEFIRRFNPLISSVVVRLLPTSKFAKEQTDDIVQDIYLKLCADNYRLLRTFRWTHPNALFGFLKVMTRNAVHDYLRAAAFGRKSAAYKIDPGDTAEPPEPPSTQTIERAVLLREIDDALNKVAPGEGRARDRMVFWLYYRQGLTARNIAAIPGMELAESGVESILGRLVSAVRQELSRSSVIRHGSSCGLRSIDWSKRVPLA